MPTPLLFAAFLAVQFGKLITAPANDAINPCAVWQADSSVSAPNSAGDEIVVTASDHSKHGDPLVRLNEKWFEAIQAVDQAIVGHIALSYN